jgi:hypothetical protein
VNQALTLFLSSFLSLISRGCFGRQAQNLLLSHIPSRRTVTSSSPKAKTLWPHNTREP